jgi:hypothetical protein
MKQKKDGNIYEINLRPFYEGYAYVKYVQVNKYISGDGYGDILLVSDSIFEHTNNSFLDSIFTNLLSNPIYIRRANGLNKIFPLIKNFNITDENLIFPYIRIPKWQWEEDQGIEVKDWCVMNSNNDTLNKEYYKFEEVAHLNSIYGCVPIERLSFFIALQIYKSKGIDMPNIHELAWGQEMILKFEGKTTPYNQVPIEKRHKVALR